VISIPWRVRLGLPILGIVIVSSAAIAQPGNADLSLTFTNSAHAASLGQYFNCSVILYNAGSESATNAVLTNWLPVGVQFISATTSRGTCTESAGVVTCVLGDLPPYRSATLSMEFKAVAPGSYTNVALTASATPDPISTNNQAAFVTLVTPARFFGVGRMHTAHYLPTVTPFASNRVLVVGAPLVRTADVYNVSTRLFELPGPTQSLHSHHTATLLNNGLVLVVGGNYLPWVPEVFDPATSQFRAVGNTYAPRWFHTATLLPDGRVVLCGNAFPPLTNEVYNPVTETFSLAPSLECAPGGTLLPDGKYLSVNWGNASLYDPATGITTPTGPPIERRSYHTATLLPGKVLIAGGQIFDAPEASTATAELYDIASGTFNPTASMTMRRREHGACALSDGTALLAGGIVTYNDWALDRAEVFDPNGTINVPGVGVSDASLVEGDSGTNSMQFTIWLTSTSALPVTVDFATAGVTAGFSDWSVATLDFAHTNGTLTIPPGQTSAIVLVPIIGDNVREPNETLTLSLTLPTQAWMARSVATGTIIDNDPLPHLVLAPAMVTERDTGLSNLVFNVTLSAQSLTTVAVDFFSSNVTALAGSDYLATAGTLVFSPGETARAIAVPVIGDLLMEPDETLQFFLTNAQNATINVGEATGTILNDDGFAGRIHHFDIDPIGVLQTQTVGFPVTLRAKDAFGNPVTNFSGLVQLSAQTTNVIAANLDFEQPSLAPWVTFNDTPYDRFFRQTLFDVAGLGQRSTAFRTIAGGGSHGISQDVFLVGGITYTFTVNVAQSMEGYDMSCLGAGIYLQVGPTNVGWGTDICGGTARRTLTLAYTPPTNGVYPLQLIITRDYYFGDVLAVFADDVQISYPLITPTLLTNNFVNGVCTGLVAALQSATNVTLAANDNEGHKGYSNPFDVQPAVDLGLSALSQIQGTPPLRTGMRLQFNLAVTNRGPSAAIDTVVRYELPSNLVFLSATNPQGSISNLAGTITWTIGSLAKGSNVTAIIVCRADVPGDVTNRFNASSPVLDLDLTDNSVALPTHVDPPLLVIGDASGTETFATATGMVFRLTLSGPSAQTITAGYFTADGTATNELDYLATDGTVVFPPGATNAAIVVYALDDIYDEPDRSFTVLLTNAVNAIVSDGSGTGTVLDDDPPPAIFIADALVVEGDSGTTNAAFQLTLSKPAIVDVSVRFTTATNTASINDYTHTASTIVFPAGSTNASCLVPVRGNTVNEPDESFFVNLTLPANATIADAQAVGTIINDDAVPGRLDHFAWDPVPSPRYNARPFPVTLRALDYLGSPATNGLVTATVTASTENGFLNRLQDDFEDGDSIGWTNFNSSFTAIVTNETAAQGVKSLRLTGGAGSSRAGLRHSISNGQPNKISFSARVGRTNQVAGRVTALASSLYRSAVFYFNNNGQMGLIDPQIGFRGVPYQSNRWYQVELIFNWNAQKVDCRIDGALTITNVTFFESAAFIDAVLLANQDNTTSWWDDIRVFNDNLTNTFTITPSNFTAFVNGAKSNLVTISGIGTNVFLSADDGLEHVGRSGLFDLLPLPILSFTQYGWLADGPFQLIFQGPPDRNFLLLASSNLTAWDAILTFNFTNGPLITIDPASTDFDRRFYRLAPAEP
jgi:uncharacterized repeat protein (TIGR01451 family)